MFTRKLGKRCRAIGEIKSDLFNTFILGIVSFHIPFLQIDCSSYGCVVISVDRLVHVESSCSASSKMKEKHGSKIPPVTPHYQGVFI